MDSQDPTLIAPWRSERLAVVCFVLWVSVHLGAITAVFLPGNLGGGRLPWSMFARQTPGWSVAFAEAEIDGTWAALPIDDWFRYRRGATAFSLVHEAPAMKGPKLQDPKAEFAQWCADRAVREGLGSPTQIRLGRRYMRLDSDDSREVEFGVYPVTPR